MREREREASKKQRNKITSQNAFSAHYSAYNALYYATATVFAHQRVDIKPNEAKDSYGNATEKRPDTAIATTTTK